MCLVAARRAEDVTADPQTNRQGARRGRGRDIRGAQAEGGGGTQPLQAEEEVFEEYSWYSSYYKQSAAVAVAVVVL